MKNWHLGGKSYTKREFAQLLKDRDQIIKYEQTRKSYQKEVEKKDALIYTRGIDIFAVI